MDFYPGAPMNPNYAPPQQQQQQQQLPPPVAAAAAPPPGVGGLANLDFANDADLLFFDENLDEGLDEIDADVTLTESEKAERRRERLERNREIARNCRKRKRERVEALVDEVSTLRETNRELELKLKVMHNKLGEATSGRGNRGHDDEQKRLREVTLMTQMLDQKCSDDDIARRLRTYTEVYSDFGEERKKLVSVHMHQLEQLLLPTQVSKMLLWVLKQKDEFYVDGDPNSMWGMLCTQLELDEPQKQALKEHRAALSAQSASMKKVLQHLNRLGSDIQRNMAARREAINKVLSIISPVQIVKFLQWVEQNQACIHMLNSLWTVNKERQESVMRDLHVDAAGSSSSSSSSNAGASSPGGSLASGSSAAPAHSRPFPQPAPRT